MYWLTTLRTYACSDHLKGEGEREGGRGREGEELYLV